MKKKDIFSLILFMIGTILYSAFIATKTPNEANTILLIFILSGIVAIVYILFKITNLLKDQNKKK